MLALIAATIIAVTSAPIAVTTATYAAAIASAPANATVRLGPGNYPPLYLRGATARKTPVTITADPAAVSTGIRCDACSGVTVTGLTFDGGGALAAGLVFNGGDHITVSLNRFANFIRAGVEFNSISDATIYGNTVTHSGSDGFDIGLSRRIVVDRNICTDFAPTPDAHGDCIQLISLPTAAPTADVTITGNIAIGNMQGISAFDHQRPDATGKLVDDGGYDRITITGNIVAVSDPNGIATYACRKCIVAGNTVRTLAGSKYPTQVYADPKSSPAGINDVGVR